MKTDVAIVGGGPGGSAAAMYLLRFGIRPVIIEKETFPRYHIGESMTGETGGLLRELGLGEQMLAARHPVKHGVKVYGNSRGHWFVPVMQRTPEGALQEQSTWQVRRSVFDEMMRDEALARGATLVTGRAVKPLLDDHGSVRGVQVRPADGGLLDVEAEIVLDCSGQATFLASQGVTGPKYLGAYDKQIAIFSQVAGFVRDTGGSRENMPGNALIFYRKKYHWAWAIPLDDEVVSVGIVTPAQYFLDRKESKVAYITRELRELSPELSRRLPEVKLLEDVHIIPNYSFQVRKFAGKGYICIGDAHRFVDPIFSFGLWLTIKEGGLAAEAVKDYLNGKNRDAENPFEEYMIFAERGVDVLEDVLDMFWENPLAFAVFVHARYREAMIDVFAGRVYHGQPSAGVTAFRRLLKRERTYDSDGLYSMPIGSRYHPERAALWDASGDAVETTERWMREK